MCNSQLIIFAERTRIEVETLRGSIDNSEIWYVGSASVIYRQSVRQDLDRHLVIKAHEIKIKTITFVASSVYNELFEGYGALQQA